MTRNSSSQIAFCLLVIVFLCLRYRLSGDKRYTTCGLAANVTCLKVPYSHFVHTLTDASPSEFQQHLALQPPLLNISSSRFSPGWRLLSIRSWQNPLYQELNGALLQWNASVAHHDGSGKQSDGHLNGSRTFCWLRITTSSHYSSQGLDSYHRGLPWRLRNSTRLWGFAIPLPQS